MNKNQNINDKHNALSGAAVADESPVLKCDEVQDLLLDYMSRQLGDARSAIINKHLRKCEKCRAEASEIQNTLDLLHKASAEEAEISDHLTEQRKKRILRVIIHPVIDWMHQHHKLISVIITIVVLGIIFAFLRIPAREEEPEPSIPIWKYFKSGKLPELVEKARLEGREEQERNE